jgi:hypothetical protein
MLDIYNFVVSILGSNLPVELTWLYSVGTLLVLFMILCIVVFPFFIIYKLSR